MIFWIMFGDDLVSCADTHIERPFALASIQLRPFYRAIDMKVTIVEFNAN